MDRQNMSDDEGRMTRAEVAPNAVEGWNVEQFNDDGACLLAIFSGPNAEERARHYAENRNDFLDAVAASRDFGENGGTTLADVKRELDI